MQHFVTHTHTHTFFDKMSTTKAFNEMLTRLHLEYVAWCKNGRFGQYPSDPVCEEIANYVQVSVKDFKRGLPDGASFGTCGSMTEHNPVYLDVITDVANNLFYFHEKKDADAAARLINIVTRKDPDNYRAWNTLYDLNKGDVYIMKQLVRVGHLHGRDVARFARALDQLHDAVEKARAPPYVSDYTKMTEWYERTKALLREQYTYIGYRPEPSENGYEDSRFVLFVAKEEDERPAFEVVLENGYTFEVAFDLIYVD